MPTYPMPDGSTKEEPSQSAATADGWTPSMGTNFTAADNGAVGSTAPQSTSAVDPNSAGSAALAQQQLSQALASGNVAAAKEIASEFAQTHGLDVQKFQASLDQYAQNFGLAQAAVTGKNPDGSPTLAASQDAFTNAISAAGLTGFFTPPGSGSGNLQQDAAAWQAAQTKAGNPNTHTEQFVNQPASVQAQFGYTAPTQTLAGQQQQATLSGQYNGSPTEAARQFNTTAAQTALNDANSTGLAALQYRSTLQNDPFRQLQYQYGTQANSGLNAAVQGLTGQYGLGGGFTAPSSNVDANGFPVQSGGTAPAMGSAQQQAQATGLVNPNQIIARNYNSAPANVQNAMTSALSMNNGQTQAENAAAIQKNLPGFNAPSFGLATV